MHIQLSPCSQNRIILIDEEIHKHNTIQFCENKLCFYCPELSFRGDNPCKVIIFEHNIVQHLNTPLNSSRSSFVLTARIELFLPLITSTALSFSMLSFAKSSATLFSLFILLNVSLMHRAGFWFTTTAFFSRMLSSTESESAFMARGSYAPRSLSIDQLIRGVIHSKCLMIHSKCLMIHCDHGINLSQICCCNLVCRTVWRLKFREGSGELQTHWMKQRLVGLGHDADVMVGVGRFVSLMLCNVPCFCTSKRDSSSFSLWQHECFLNPIQLSRSAFDDCTFPRCVSSPSVCPESLCSRSSSPTKRILTDTIPVVSFKCLVTEFKFFFLESRCIIEEAKHNAWGERRKRSFCITRTWNAVRAFGTRLTELEVPSATRTMRNRGREWWTESLMIMTFYLVY